MRSVLLISDLIVVALLIRRDTRRRQGVSTALWIPTLWVGILASRPLSAWIGTSGATDTLDGSPVDRLFFLGLIVASLLVLSRRQLSWTKFWIHNWPVALFYAYLLVTVIWANSPPTSLKRWAKEFGNILVVLVILTETNPLEAIRAVFVRCAFVLIPLSVIFIRYFPELGRRYNAHNGAMEPTGVTFQKNSLGTMLLVLGFVLFWDWFANKSTHRRGRIDSWTAIALLAMTILLFRISDSKTSMVAAVLAATILILSRYSAFHRHARAVVSVIVGGAVIIGLAMQFFDAAPSITASLGRDMTFTGRTVVWRELLNLHTDPIFGAGFMSIWDDSYYRSLATLWPGSAHNGYLEIYLAGGIFGVVLLVVMLASTGFRIYQAFPCGEFAAVRFAMVCIAIVANLMESNFASMTPVGFLFLIAAFSEGQWIDGRAVLVSASRATTNIKPTAAVLGTAVSSEIT